MSLPTRHRDLWFEDGNVILIAENTGFRVFKNVLARHSEIFRDAFQMPQPATLEECFEGCPIVRMADDAAGEVAFILGMLFNDAHKYVLLSGGSVNRAVHPNRTGFIVTRCK